MQLKIWVCCENLMKHAFLQIHSNHVIWWQIHNGNFYLSCIPFSPLVYLYNCGRLNTSFWQYERNMSILSCVLHTFISNVSSNMLDSFQQKILFHSRRLIKVKYLNNHFSPEFFFFTLIVKSYYQPLGKVIE